MSSIRLPLYLLAAYGLIVLGEGAWVALQSGVGNDLSRAVITVAGLVWLLHGLRRGQAWAWWLATGGATVFLISVLTALVVVSLDGAGARLPLSMLIKVVLLAPAAGALLLPTSRRHYLGKSNAAS